MAASIDVSTAEADEDGIEEEFFLASSNAGSGRKAPIAVVIPVRNRAGDRLRNALCSLNWQSSGPPERILVVSHGSRLEIDEEIRRMCAEEHATLLTIGEAGDPWNKPLALNTGIRKTSPRTPYLMTMDADMILAPNFLDTVIHRLGKGDPVLVLCRSADLSPEISIPGGSGELLESYETLRSQATLRGKYGTGGIQAARRSFFFEVRGYDEDLAWWGAMDGDMVNRARLAGLTVEWVDQWTSMLHQWHPSKHASLSDLQEIDQAKHSWRKNHELKRTRAGTLARNSNGWGIVPGH